MLLPIYYNDFISPLILFTLFHAFLLLVYGNYEIIQEEHPTIYAYSRTLEDQKMLILLNFSELESSIAMSSYNSANEVLINNYSELSVDKNTITLKPYQAVVLKL